MELFVCEALEAPAFNGHQPSDHTEPPDTVLVLGGKGEHRFPGIFDPSALLTDCISVWRQDGSRSHHENTGAFSPVLADTGILPCGDASGMSGEFRVRVKIDKHRLGGAAGQRVRHVLSHASPAAVDAWIGDIDAVTGTGFLIARLRQDFDRKMHSRLMGGSLGGQIQHRVLFFLRTLRHRL